MLKAFRSIIIELDICLLQRLNTNSVGHLEFSLHLLPLLQLFIYKLKAYILTYIEAPQNANYP